MHGYLDLAARCVVTIVFAASALGKARAPREFAAALREMRVAPERLTGPLVVAVPLVEAVLAAAVWAPPVAAWTFALAAGLTAVFTVVLVSVIRRRIDTACSCFGVSATPVSATHVVRNLVLLAVAATGFAATSENGAGAGPPMDSAGVLVALLGAVCVSVLIISADILADVFSGSSAR